MYWNSYYHLRFNNYFFSLHCSIMPFKCFTILYMYKIRYAYSANGSFYMKSYRYAHMHLFWSNKSLCDGVLRSSENEGNEAQWAKKANFGNLAISFPKSSYDIGWKEADKVFVSFFFIFKKKFKIWFFQRFRSRLLYLDFFLPKMSYLHVLVKLLIWKALESF